MMNKITTDHVVKVEDLLSPINQPMANVQSLDNIEPTQGLLDWLSDLTNGSYDAWLKRGGADTLWSVE